MRSAIAAFLILCCLASPVRAEIGLYDGSLATLPSAQGWLYLTDPFLGASAVQSTVGTAVRLDTTPVMGDAAGYFGNVHPELPSLDHMAGFRVAFDVHVLTESHVGGDRAGFSVIAIANDLSAIEIGFWTNEIWAQSDAPLFTHAEGVTFNTADATNRYELELLRGTYTLFANGTEILAGPLRDYSSFGAPYNVAGFLFWGDDTGSASAIIACSSVSVSLYPNLQRFFVSSGSVDLTADNLEQGTAYGVEQSVPTGYGSWTNIGMLSSTGVISSWTGAVDPAVTNASIRLTVP